MVRLAGLRVLAVLGLLVLAGLQAGCSGVGSTPSLTAARKLSWRWRGTTFGPRGLLLGSAAIVSVRDIWASGIETDDNNALVMEHWNGADWTAFRLSATTGAGIDAMAATSARDVWAVGFTENHKVLIVRWDDSTWAGVRVPRLPGDGQLSGVAAISARDVWAVGSIAVRGRVPFSRPLIMHWDGTRWRQFPAAPAHSDSYLVGIAGSSARDMWAVGFSASSLSRTLIEHWDGTAWTTVRSPDPFRCGDALTAVAVLSGRNAWAAGTTTNCIGGNRNLIVHWDGTAWQPVASPRIPGGRLDSIAPISARDIWAAGNSFGPRCMILHWAGDAWSIAYSPDLRDCMFRTVGYASAHAWAVGSWGQGANYIDRGLIVRLIGRA